VTNHVDFDAAPEERRWTGPLDELSAALRHGAYEAKGEWFWVVLPHGALVAMRVPEDFRKELRIARKGGLKDEAALNKWLAEVRTFQKYLGAERWPITNLVGKPGEEGPIFVLLKEPAPLGAKEPEKCARCGEPAEKGVWAEALCNRCATQLGAEEAQHRQEG
jgi:hypothetical protein